jgi:phosphoribosylformimino-5-aminoimidazole carboxamide ribotide isomerase
MTLMPTLLPIPAIDLMDGHVVRLARGRAEAKTVYSDDPAAVAREFEAAGARRLHVVDLDGAFGGRPRNRDAIRAIRDAVSMEIEVGGGLRTEEDVREVFELGAQFAILGTSALRDRALVGRLVERWGERIIVGIDAKDGRVAVEGWVETSDLEQVDFARELESLGVTTVIATDIATDGMLSGPNLASLRALAEATTMNVIASGGVASIGDLRALRDLRRPNLIGAIVGRAIYEKKLDLRAAVAEFGGSSSPIG